jgi:hypothetical protein|tara:strand:+ start:1972 stop:2907 length:936 start_codon:yes stop_codon:yes gene_type:complete
MEVVNYMSSVPAGNTNIQKEQLINYFHEGILRHPQDTSSINYDQKLIPCDVAVMQGWVYANTKPLHLKLRKNIITQQLNQKKYVIVADANLFRFADDTNAHGYLRYSANGIFPTTGNYFDSIIDTTRCNQILQHHNISLLPYKKTGSKIILCCQRNSGWSMKGIPIEDWIITTVKKIRKYSDRHIIIRAHPGDRTQRNWTKLPNIQLLLKKNDLSISNTGIPIHQDLVDAWAVVNHNSSSIVGPIIQGHYAFVTDKEDSQCKDVADDDFSNIENPKEFNREYWMQLKSMSHWSFEELKNGQAWNHMRNHLQ